MDPETHADMVTIMQESTADVYQRHASNSFAHLFCDQQQLSSMKTSSTMRWHPLMVKWCIYLRHLSSTAYEALQQTGCVSLPSQRTLQDYTHCARAEIGFSVATDRQLLNAIEVQTCPVWKKQVVLLMDEMHIKADLMYDKMPGGLFIE